MIRARPGTAPQLPSMSALPPKADIGTRSWNVRFVPNSGHGTVSLDHLVGEQLHRNRHLQTKRFGGLKIDH
jgi:hypothetical protein